MSEKCYNNNSDNPLTSCRTNVSKNVSSMIMKKMAHEFYKISNVCKVIVYVCAYVCTI